MTCLIDEESPRQQPHRVAAVHREEATVVVGDRPEPLRIELYGDDELTRVMPSRQGIVEIKLRNGRELRLHVADGAAHHDFHR